MQNVERRGQQLRDELAAIGKELGLFKEIRGRGLMIGAELVEKYAGKAGDMIDTARAHGVLVLQAGPNVLRFLPPLNITKEEMAQGVKRLKAALKEYTKKAG